MMILSIVIPVYNGAKHISRCLDSIWSQGLDDNEFEVICVDDCSTDNSYDLLCGFANNRSNLTVLQNSENKRAGGARNYGVREAKGEYILFIDADDYFHNGSILRAVSYLQECNLDIMVCDFARHKESDINSNLVHNFGSNRVLSGTDFLNTNSLPWAPWKYIFSRKLMIDNGCWFEERVSCEDVDWTHKLAYFANKMQYHPILLTHHILNEEGQTASEYRNGDIIWHRFFCAARLYDLTTLYQENRQAVGGILNVTRVTIMEGVKALLCAYLPIRDKVDMIVRYIPNDPALGRNVSLIRRFPTLFAICSNLASPFIYTAVRLKRRFRGR